MSNSGMVERRSMLKAAAALGGLSTLAIIALAVSEAAQECESRTTSVPGARLEDVSAGPNAKLTIERRGQVVLLGVNRPYIQNRIDPETHRWASCVMVFGRPTNCPPWSRRGHLLIVVLGGRLIARNPVPAHPREHRTLDAGARFSPLNYGDLRRAFIQA